jgi:hypothetical protein
MLKKQYMINALTTYVLTRTAMSVDSMTMKKNNIPAGMTGPDGSFSFSNSDDIRNLRKNFM